MFPHFVCANNMTEEINMSEHPWRCHYAAFVATGVPVVLFSIDLDINHLKRVELPLCGQVACGWCWESAESLENIFVYQKAVSVARRLVMAHSPALDPSQELLSHGFRRCTVQVAVLNDHIGVSLPDFTSCFGILCLGASAGVGGLDLFEALVLNPLVDDVEGSCKGRVRAKCEDCSPDGETPAVYEMRLSAPNEHSD